MTLGQNIARLRAQKNLSQGDLADALEVSRQSVSKWETDASIPELDKLLRLAELFGVTLDELVKGESAQPEAARGEVPDKESAGAYTAAAPAADRRHDPAVLRRADRDTHHALRRNARRLYTGAAAVCLRDHLPDGEAAHGALVRVGAVSDGRAVSALRDRIVMDNDFLYFPVDGGDELYAPCNSVGAGTVSACDAAVYATLLPDADTVRQQEAACVAWRRLARVLCRRLGTVRVDALDRGELHLCA